MEKIMARIEWTRLSGDDIEEMLAVMLLRKYRHGQHIKANPGDGGIDVFVPDLPGSRTGVNYQIKKFADKIGTSQKAQIRKSMKAAQATTKSGVFVVTDCYIVVPLTPTTADYTWLRNASGKFTFRADWYGLAHIEGLVSEYPDVVDYYLNQQGEYFKDILNNLTGLVRDVTNMDGEGVILPGQMAQHIGRAEKAVNKDPFYYYRFATSSVPPIPTVSDGLVVTVVERLDEDLYVTIDVFAKFADAVNIRPCHIRFKALPVNDEERTQLEGFNRFGAPAVLTASVEVDLPGGLGGVMPKATFSISPVAPANPDIYRYEIVRSDGSVASRCFMETVYTSRGAKERNALIRVIDQAKVFEIEWRFDITSKTTSMNLIWLPMVGRVAAEVIDSLHFLAHLHEGQHLRISERYVPTKANDLPLAQFENPPKWGQVFSIVADLVEIQRVADRAVLIPAPEDLDRDTLEEIVLCARMVRGEEVHGTWQSLEGGSVGSDFDHSLFQDAAPVRASGIRELEIGQEIYTLGEFEVVHESATLELGPVGGDGKQSARFVPSGSNLYVMRMVPGRG